MKRDFALIKPNKATGEHDVMTITIFDNPTEANMVSRAIYGETAYAIESSMWNVQLPAIYKEGTFQNIKSKDARDEKGNLISVRTGEEQAERIPTQAEQIAELKKQNEALKQAVDNLVLDTLGGE